MFIEKHTQRERRLLGDELNQRTHNDEWKVTTNYYN